eukprot:TRINITY_DN5646_c0_g1_i1.p1 TRINITY_DN5646_c0_g1~~TRINITY_DN5646_c0_g1_i1.p1  ORF type:complete len:146 (-),score=27.86 TRINITY_DN5646_c0_g1_i1:26-463(-)
MCIRDRYMGIFIQLTLIIMNKVLLLTLCFLAMTLIVATSTKKTLKKVHRQSHKSGRSGITIKNYSDETISAAVEKDLSSDSDKWYDLQSGEEDTWGRKADTYKIWLYANGNEFQLSLTKSDEEVDIIVYGYKNIEVYNPISWRYL